MQKLNINILDSLNSHIAVLDSDGVIIYTNKAWDNFYKKNKKGLTNKKSGIGVNYLDRCLKASKTNKDALQSYKGIKSVMNGKTNSFDNKYSVNDSEWYSIKVSPLDGSEDEKTVIIFEDITEQVLAEEELVLEKLRFEALFSETTIGMVVLDDSFHFLQANNSFCDFIGYSEAELKKFTPLDITVPDDLVKSEGMLDNMAKNKKKKFKLEKKYIRKDGQIVWGEVINKQIKLFDKRSLYYATIVDVTERKKDEIEIEKAKQELTNIVEYAGIGIVYTNSDREVISINKKFLNILGYKKESDLLGKTIMSFTHPDDVEKDLAQVVKLENKESSTFDMEKRYVRRDKSIVWVNLNVSTIEDEVTGEVTNFIGMVRDITEKKKAEVLKNIVFNITKKAGEGNILLHDFCHYLQEELSELMETENFYIAQQTNRETITFPYLKDQYTEVETPFFREAGNGLSEYVIKTSTPLFLNGNETIKFQKKNKMEIYGKEARSWLGAPIISQNKTIGVIACQSYSDENLYDNFQLEVLSFIGSQIGMFIERINAEEEKAEFLNLTKKSEARYRGLFEKMNEGLFFSSKEGIIKIVNPSFCKIVGYTEEELVGKNGYELLLSDNIVKKQVKKKVKERAQGKSDQYEVRIHTKKGEKLWIRVSSSPQYSSKRKFEGVMSIVSDITEMKRKEEEITRAKNKFELVVNNIGDVVYKSTFGEDDSSIVVDYITENIVDVMGFDNNKYRYRDKSLMASLNQEAIPEMIKFNKKVRDAKESKQFNIEYEWYHPIKKKWLWMSETIVPEIKEGKVVGQFGTVRDVTEKKAAEERLKESEDRLKLATTNAGMGIWDWDVKNNVLVWDDSMYELYEVEKSDFTGAYEAWEKTLYVHDVVDANKEVEMALSGEKKFNTVFRIVTAENQIKHIQAIGNVDFDAEGNAVRMIGTNTDVTEKVLMEQEKHNAIIKTEEAERQRISHDLHDGLGQRIAAANMWINTLGDLVKNQLDEEAMSVFKAGKKLINDATKETRLVSHNIMPRSLKQYGLEKTTIELVNNIQKINENVSIKLTSNLGGARFGEVKELSVFRVLQESINNALKHSKADKIDVILNVDNNLLFVNVNDNGEGFDVDEVMDKNSSGIGLLSLSQRINMIGGKLNIDSKPSHGTIITIAIYLEEPIVVLNK